MESITRRGNHLNRLNPKGYTSIFSSKHCLKICARAPECYPPICLLDPDGDIVAHLMRQKRATRSALTAYSSSRRAIVTIGSKVGRVAAEGRQQKTVDLWHSLIAICVAYSCGNCGILKLQWTPGESRLWSVRPAESIGTTCDGLCRSFLDVLH